MNVLELFDLSEHGPDTYVGVGPQYPWGGLYGGQIVAQALRAAAATVDSSMQPHSLRAYFIRRGDATEPVRYEVDRIRNGRSFVTRRVVARQAVGAILNLEASFQAAEQSIDVETIVAPPGLPAPEETTEDSWSPLFDRRWVAAQHLPADGRTGAGRAAAWLRVREPIGDDPLLHTCALAYLSDDLPTDAVVRAHPIGQEDRAAREATMFSASLDHTMWFHRPLRADEWHLHEFTCHSFVGGRGLAIGHVFGSDGTHAATIAQEVLMRDNRARSGGTVDGHAH
jgi:acyl-CoA thioesterase-2